MQSNGGAILLTAPTNEYNDLINQAAVSRPANFDTDGDGMPDSWETARGLNPSVADNNVVVTSAESPAMAGYTWIEMYLNDLTLQANWAGGTSGNWDTILNWDGQLPNLQDSTANFGNVGAAAQVTVNSDEHVGQLAFDNPSGYTLTGGGDITMDILGHNGGGFATVNVFSGVHTIAVPFNLASDTHFTIAGGGMLNITGALSATGRNISKDGGGSLGFMNVRAASITISAGSIQISSKSSPNSAAGTSVVNALSITTGASLDLTNNAMVIDYSTLGTLLGDTRQELFDGRLTTSLSAGGHAIGYADKASLGRTSFAGQSVDSTSLLLAYTLVGDSNLDGVVNAADFAALASHYGASSGSVWTQGDFNDDGVVNTADFNLLAANFNQTLGAPALGALVPEPLAILPICVTLLAARRRGVIAQKGGDFRRRFMRPSP